MSDRLRKKTRKRRKHLGRSGTERRAVFLLKVTQSTSRRHRSHFALAVERKKKVKSRTVTSLSRSWEILLHLMAAIGVTQSKLFNNFQFYYALMCFLVSFSFSPKAMIWRLKSRILTFWANAFFAFLFCFIEKKFETPPRVIKRSNRTV